MSDSQIAAPRDAESADQRYRAPALDKGLDIIELLAREPGGLTRGEIVRAMGRGPSEIYRMLERLVARDYVSRSAEGDRYALTMKLFILAHRHPPSKRLIAQATPLMEDFALHANQSCHLVIKEKDSGIVLAVANCPNWEYGIRAGAVLDLMRTGSGRLLLAYHSEAGTSPDLVREAEFRRYRDEGCRVGPSFQVRGVTDISVPIFADDGSVIAVLTCPFIERLDVPTDVPLPEVLTLMQDVSRRLSIR